MSRSMLLTQPAHWTRRCVAHNCCRHASTRSNPYPYPAHPDPQPHQIFHLPRSATQQQVKTRYYDLVRIYHPDSPVARKWPADVAQARFQAISRAYDALRGKSAITGEVLAERERPDPGRFMRPGGAPRRRGVDETVGDERWKERVLVGATLVAVLGFVVQTTVARREALLQAGHGSRPGVSARGQAAMVDEALAESSDAGRPR